MQTATLNVEGMSCNHCVKAVEGAVQEVGAQGTVDLNAKTVDISYDEAAVSLDAIKSAIEEQGYDVV
ncbi:copper ion binding protein [Saccharibacillus brassicae]|uniref:Heavy-metal-associated domain-containing protein n=1 Tax=Saccharibacillus brassicae TaxID=2583377 RepID=A0A4Y6UVC9_SACBS|nr:copper ion binding protein [Saccharibacillus brassicae]QDH21669.1 heavy-metal-associated domain-containing protein [Saccharibacillus brassicae]